MPRTISFEVRGKPQQKGSKRAFAIRRKSGKMGAVVVDDNKRSAPWQTLVQAAGIAVMGKDPPLSGPLAARIVFSFSRPKGHYRTGKNAHLLKRTAPGEHAQEPDIDKLLRTLFDGLSGIVIQDDRQICHVTAVRQWSLAFDGVNVTVEQLQGVSVNDTTASRGLAKMLFLQPLA
jgi:Holliday junction resolvase RusA-like endonuclease